VRPRRILILSASVGAGHLRAAEAIELAARQLDPDATIDNSDVLEFTNAAFRRVYAKSYFDLVSSAPHLLGYIYDRLDRAPSPRGRSDKLRLLVERLNLTRFHESLEDQSWHVIVSTHFLPAELIASLRRRRKLRTPHFVVTTDLETHRLWVNQPCERYFTATQDGAVNLSHWGVPAESIRVTGIPIHPVFSQPTVRADCLTRHGLGGDRPVVLQLSGGFGIGPVEELFRAILAIEVPIELVVVTGRNPELKQKLEQIKDRRVHRVHVLGFTKQIDELMAAAEIVVSKPGGLTSSEVLARGAAMAIVNPIPGQESRNSDFLLENGAAVRINSIATLPYKLSQLLADPARLARLRRNARRLARPKAAFDVARAALWHGLPGRDPSHGLPAHA